MYMHACMYVCMYVCVDSETSHADHLYRSTTSLYQPAFHITEITSTVSFLCCGKLYKLTTSLNGPHMFSTVSGRFREVLLYIHIPLLSDFSREYSVHILKVFINSVLNIIYMNTLISRKYRIY